MRNKVSFIILSHCGAGSRQITFCKKWLTIFSVLGIAALGSIGFVIYDYFHLIETVADKQTLEHQLLEREWEITGQREQIQQFAEDINALRSRFIALKGFEKKIRIMADIERKGGEEGLFGVGGSMPGDLDPKIDLSEKHDDLMREMQDQLEHLELASANQAGGFQSLLEALDDKRNLLACTPSIRPTNGWISSKFGRRRSPFTGRREFHKGYDISAQKGTDIIATADGTVTFSGKNGLMGRMITIDHGNGIVTRYGHCSKLLKKKGESVERGDVIALVGSSGRTTGPHVHYEVYVKGIAINPERFIFN